MTTQALVLAVILAVWVIGIPVAYLKVFKNWENTEFEKVWFSCLWPAVAILYPIHWIHNKA